MWGEYEGGDCVGVEMLVMGGAGEEGQHGAGDQRVGEGGSSSGEVRGGRGVVVMVRADGGEEEVARLQQCEVDRLGQAHDGLFDDGCAGGAGERR